MSSTNKPETSVHLTDDRRAEALTGEPAGGYAWIRRKVEKSVTRMPRREQVLFANLVEDLQRKGSHPHGMEELQQALEEPVSLPSLVLMGCLLASRETGA